MSDLYILDEAKQPVAVDGVIAWGKWFETADRHVANDVIGDSRVSTVFLGMDHSFNGGPPILFETMVFGGPLSDEMDRYPTWADAVAGHTAMVQRVRAAS